MLQDARQSYEIENGVFQFKEHVASGNISEANRYRPSILGLIPKDYLNIFADHQHIRFWL